jgi:hypothetical protein
MLWLLSESRTPISNGANTPTPSHRCSPPLYGDPLFRFAKAQFWAHGPTDWNPASKEAGHSGGRLSGEFRSDN